VAPPFGLPESTFLYAVLLAVLGFPLLGLTLARRAARRQLRFGLALGLLAWLLVVQVACGGGGELTPSAPLPRPGTPTGTFNITITGTSGSLQHSTMITLIVQ
jgi:Na+/proline symporter